MRYPIRWMLGSFLLVGSSLMSGAFADTKADILSLTGNARAKLVWVRFPWCDNNYNPVQAYNADVSLYNEDGHTQLMLFDTDAGTTRYLDSTISSHCYPKFTRKNGNHVVWTDRVNQCAWIRDFAGTTAKRKLITGGDYLLVACQYNSATNEEFVYVENTSETVLSKIPLKSDYTVDVSQKTPVYSAANKFDRCRISVSEDGKYIGCATPWPDTYILDVAKKELLYRHTANEYMGCEPCIAPDNSYRFLQLRDDHAHVRMWDAALSTTNWDVDVLAGLPYPGPALTWEDCTEPKWTNHPSYFVNSSPLQMGYEVNNNQFDIFGMSPTQVQAENPNKAGAFYLGKWSSDFKTVEKYVRVTDGDIRHREIGGDAWIAPTISAIRQTADRTSRFSIVNSLPSDHSAASALINAAGRVVNLRGVKVDYALRAATPGVYAAEVPSQGGIRVSKIFPNR